MPRKLPTQVPQTVSRLLGAGFLKQPPAWYDAVTSHPPQPVPTRHQVARPDEDLPLSLRSTAHRPVASTSSRDPRNSKKKARALGPSLAPKPIVYDEDRIRQQFFRDHPWEAYRPQTLVELTDQVSAVPKVNGDPKRLRSYGRNPTAEDFVKCTLAAHREGGLSLSQAYHNTLSSFYGLRAEHEHATRYAAVEARYFGADLGKSETQRGFEKEERQLESWTAWATGQTPTTGKDGQQQVQGIKAPRVKRTDSTFTSGSAYLDAARAFRDGKVDLSRFAVAQPATPAAAPSPSLSPSSTSVIDADSSSQDDFLNLRQSAGLQDASDSEPTPTESQENLVDEQRFRKRVGTRGQRI